MTEPHRVRRISTAFVPQWPTARYLWHLIANNRDDKLLTFLEGGLYFARLDTFNDKCEGTMPQKNLGLLSKLPPFQIKMVTKVYQLAVRRSFASCWHMSDDDPSDYAWESFGRKRTGIAFRTTPISLKSAIQPIIGPNGPTYIGTTRYIKHWKDSIPEANILEAQFVLRDDLCDEREARVLIHAHGTAASRLAYLNGLNRRPLVKRPPARQLNAGSYGFVGNHDYWKAIVPKVNPRVLIHEIVIGESIDSGRRQQIMDLIRRYHLEDLVRM